MKQFWDERYRSTDFVYGEEPNHFLKEQLDELATGTILFSAEGEGRNGVYAADQGWTVFAFDQSGEAKKKATQLADRQNVSLTYEVGTLDTLTYAPQQFDAIALIYAHFPADKKSAYHQTLSTYLRPGGTLIFEAFGKQHLDYNRVNPAVGGPKDLDMLFSVEELAADFPDFEIIQLAEQEVDLSEGQFHNGTGSVVRMVGRKQ